MIRANKEFMLRIRVPDEAVARIDEACELAGLSRSEWVRARLASGLERMGIDNRSLLRYPKCSSRANSTYVYTSGAFYLERVTSGRVRHPKLLGLIDASGLFTADPASSLSGPQVAKLYRKQCAKDGVDIEKLPERVYKFLALYPEKL